MENLTAVLSGKTKPFQCLLLAGSRLNERLGR